MGTQGPTGVVHGSTVTGDGIMVQPGCESYWDGTDLYGYCKLLIPFFWSAGSKIVTLPECLSLDLPLPLPVSLTLLTLPLPLSLPLPLGPPLRPLVLVTN